MLDMSVRRAVAVAVTALALPTSAVAEGPGECHVVDIAFQPALRTDLNPGVNPPPQIVVWLEDAAGQYLDTLYITKEIGSHGLGNRPGRFDFNSGPLWPYGRRITTFPVWAHRHGHDFDLVVFQNADDDNLSHPFNQSSRDTHYCRPMQPLEPAWDALTCASPNSVYTDKGMLSTSGTSKYPPRSDLTRAPGMDHASVETFAALNPFDVVSRATPTPDELAEVTWPIPPGLASGSYVMWVEVAKEFDHNATYSETAYPSPSGIPWAEYGDAYRGQPSVVFKVPFSIGTTETIAQVTEIEGYGDPDGLDGTVRAPDATISTAVVGSGVGRFALVSDADGMFRVRVTARPEFDAAVPAAPAEMTVTTATANAVTVRFIAPGDDGVMGRVTGYDVRYRVGAPVTAANFDDPDSIDPKLALAVVDGGAIQELTLERLLPETDYSVGIRAYDDCHNTSELTVISFTTPERPIGEVDACFVATAAYGSLMAADVQMLRHMRDSVLRKTVLGELAVEAYYTFGPALAGVVGESELLRATAREVLAPIVRYVRAFRF